MSYTYSWHRQDFPPTIYDGVARNNEFEIRIGGVTHGVVFGDQPPFSTHLGRYYSLDDAKSALIKNFEENEEKYLQYKTPIGTFVPSAGMFGLTFQGLDTQTPIEDNKMKWVKSERSSGGKQLNLKDCEGWVYLRKGWWVGEFIELPNVHGSVADIFKSEQEAINWCEHKAKVKEIVWRVIDEV